MSREVYLYSGLLIILIAVFESECLCTREKLVAKDTPQYISSSSVPDCQNRFITCEWEIQGPPDSKLELKVIRSRIHNRYNGHCQAGDHVKVYNGKTLSNDWKLLRVFCGRETPTFDSHGSSVTVKLSDFYGCNNSFLLQYHSIPTEYTDDGWKWGWKEILILVACAAFLLTVFHFVKKYKQSKQQRQLDTERGNIIENTTATTDLEVSIIDAGHFTDPPPKYDDVIKNDIDAPPNYFTVLNSGENHWNIANNNTSQGHV